MQLTQPKNRERLLMLEEFHDQATQILLAISKSREPHDDAAYIGHWGRLFELLRRMRAGALQFREHDRGPWAMGMPDVNAPDIQVWLVGGNMWLPVRTPERVLPGDLELATNLNKILNGAGVLPPAEGTNRE